MIFNSFASMKDENRELVTKFLKREIEIEEMTKKKKHASEEENRGGDGASIEVAKRPRGRPPGSKNKPKPPIIITREAQPSTAMRPHMLEIPRGHDVIESLARFSRRRNLGICVLAGNGSVSNVTLRQPSHPAATAAAAASGTVGFHGRFEILSISATFLPPALAAVSSPVGGGVSISLAGPQGQIVGGTVAGPLVAAGTVVVVAAAFENMTFHRLPVEDDVSVSLSSGGEAEDHHQQQQQEQEDEQHYSHRGYHHQVPPTPPAAAMEAESGGMSIYSSHFPSEVIWAPTARPPHPPPY